MERYDKFLVVFGLKKIWVNIIYAFLKYNLKWFILFYKELKNATKLEYLWPNLNKSSSNEAFWYTYLTCYYSAFSVSFYLKKKKIHILLYSCYRWIIQILIWFYLRWFNMQYLTSRKHEWEKHGRCSNLGFRNYFNWTLQLAEQFDFGR